MRCRQLISAIIFATLAHRVLAVAATRSLLNRHTQIDNAEGKGEKSICDDPRFRKTSLKLVKQAAAIGLFPDLKNHTKFEASGIEIANGHFWVIFDSSYSFGKVDLNFGFGGKDNELLGELGDESDFEDLTYVPSRDTFLVHREGVETEEGEEISTLELKVDEANQDYTIVKKCTIEFKPDPHYPNKGFEGIHYFEQDGKEYLLALCEGNFCTGGKAGKQSGNGRLVVTTFQQDGDACEWKTVKILEVPSTADFVDYAGIGFRGNKVAIVSQESAAVWIGTFDFDNLEFADKGQVFHFPRDINCNIAYCNVEGVAFIDDSRIVVASDKAKAAQPYSCTLVDQAIQIFAIPGQGDADGDEDDESDAEEL